jgi:hypothetical protein
MSFPGSTGESRKTLSFPRRRESVRLGAGAIREVQVLSRGMLTPDS